MKKKLCFTSHAAQRMAERGISHADVWLAVHYGESVYSGGSRTCALLNMCGFVGENISMRLVALTQKRQILVAVVKGCRVITAYWKSRKYYRHGGQ